MPDEPLVEESLQFGDGGRLLGILTLPNLRPPNAQELPMFVFLNAGLLHRVGPHRLYVRLARNLARMGLASLRVDLAGTGDSPPRLGLTNEQSVAADFEEILSVLATYGGSRAIVLAGLCSGADNAIRLTLNERRVVGLVLLDPVCSPDDGFHTRSLVYSYTNPARYIGWLKRRLKGQATQPLGGDEKIDPLTIRDVPSHEELQSAFERIGDRGGRVLSVFTQYALRYYNQAGQLGRVLKIKGYHRFCTELFWPEADHTYPLELHRHRLVKQVKTWADVYHST